MGTKDRKSAGAKRVASTDFRRLKTTTQRSPFGREVTRAEAAAAAAARVAADAARGRPSEPWIVQLASEAQ